MSIKEVEKIFESKRDNFDESRFSDLMFIINSGFPGRHSGCTFTINKCKTWQEVAFNLATIVLNLDYENLNRSVGREKGHINTTLQLNFSCPEPRRQRVNRNYYDSYRWGGTGTEVVPINTERTLRRSSRIPSYTVWNLVDDIREPIPEAVPDPLFDSIGQIDEERVTALESATEQLRDYLSTAEVDATRTALREGLERMGITVERAASIEETMTNSVGIPEGMSNDYN